MSDYVLVPREPTDEFLATVDFHSGKFSRSGETYPVLRNFMRALIAAAEAAPAPSPSEAVAAEREACAQTAEDQALKRLNGSASTSYGQGYQAGCKNTADAIRARAPSTDQGRV